MGHDVRKTKRLRELVVATQLVAARRVAGLFYEPEAPGYNPDAEVPWKMCSTRTRAALILTQGAMAAERAKNQVKTTAVFGMVWMQNRVEDHGEWERMAAAAPSGKVIDVAVPRKELLPGARPVRARAQELRADLPQEAGGSTPAQTETKG